MTHTTRGLSDVLEDVVADLRTTSGVTDHLESPEAIFEGHPAHGGDYPLEVAITPVFDGSSVHRGAVTRTYRVQVTVTTTKRWRDARAGEAGTTPTTAMLDVLSAVADRLEAGGGSPEAPLGAEGGVSPLPGSEPGGRMAISDDWRLRGTYETD